MWIDTGELVKLIEKVDEAERILGGSGELELDELGAVLGELRRLLYRDIASADSPAEQAGKRQAMGGGNGRQ